MLQRDALDAAGEVGLPVLAFRLLLLVRGEVVPPAQLLQELVVELGIAGLELAVDRMRTFPGQQVDAVVHHPVTGAEGAAPVHHALRRVVQVGRARMLDGRIAPARPRKTEVVPGEVVPGLRVLAADRTQRLHVEDVHVAHVGLDALGGLPGIADRPGTAVDFAQHVLDVGLHHAALALHQLDVLLAVALADQLIAEAEFLGELIHDHVIGARFEQRLDHLLAPLHRTVRGHDAARTLELRAGRQQIGAVLPHLGEHRRGGRRIGVDDHHHVELFHGLELVEAPGLRVRGMTPEDHRPKVRLLARCSPSSRERRPPIARR